MRLPFEPGAAEELEAAADWYERERSGYGTLFLSEVRGTVNRAARFPQSGTRVPGFNLDRDVRRFALRRFPYSIVTALVDSQRAVVAVAHARRRPGYWKDRLT